MNGSNSLDESDRRPLRLCPPCLKKVAWNLDFDVLSRYAKLRDFYQAHGLSEEAEWVERRMARIRREA
jgi:archaemetzincin